MRKHLLILSTLVLFTLSSCQKFAGDPISQDFSIEGSYTELQVEGGFVVTVSDVATAITVKAGENIMPNVLVEKVGNKLRIHLKPMTNTYGSELKVTLPYNAELTCVDLSGASEFHSEFGLDSDKIEIELSGASDFLGDIVANEIEMNLSGSSSIESNVTAISLDLEMSGASDATLTGQVATLKIDLSGSSEIKKTIVGNRYGLVCDQCEGSMSGASTAFIHCDGTIKVDLSGSSDLHFTGSAFTGDCHTSGASEVIHDVL